MALPLANDFEEAPGSGTAVTPGNSGGGPGNSSAFDLVTAGTGATVAYSSAHAAHGTYSMLCQTGGTAGYAMATWSASAGGARPVLYGRAYLYISSALPSASRLLEFYSGAAYLGGIAINAGRTLAIQNAALTFVQTWTAAIPLNQWVRAEWAYTFGSSGSATVTLYTSADSLTVTESHTVTGQNLGGPGATCDTTDIGWAFSAANQPALYVDCLNLNATGMPGPYSGAVPGTAPLSGTGVLGGTGAFGGRSALSGTGTLAAGGVPLYPAVYASTYAGPAGYSVSRSGVLSGTGTLTGSGSTGAGARLAGSGTLGAARSVTWRQAAALSGTGALSAAYFQSALDGTGTLSVSGVRLSYPASLAGTGTLTVLQVLGGLVLAAGGVPAPYAYPGTSQVAVAPPGTTAWQYLGTLGKVTALTYSFTCPGGADKMTCTVMVPAAYRTQLFNPGWQVRITRGGHQVWTGKLDEPVPTASGWNLTAVGTGNRGTDFLAIWSGTWPSGQPDASINGAITRGLPWANPGVGTPAGAWFGQQVDSGAQTITALLNLICTRGGLTWMVNSQPGGIPGDDLTVFPLPTVVNRLLVCTTPVARTLGGDINTIWIKYSSAVASGTTPAAFGVTSVQNAASVAAHGTLETYIDLSNAGVMSASAAQAVGNSTLQVYRSASFGGPFTGSYGQLLNAGGQAIDPGTDQAGSYVRLILTDFGQGGEVTPQFPVTFITGAYEWDDFAQQFTATPYVAVDASLQGLLSLQSTLLTPITAAS